MEIWNFNCQIKWLANKISVSAQILEVIKRSEFTETNFDVKRKLFVNAFDLPHSLALQALIEMALEAPVIARVFFSSWDPRTQILDNVDAILSVLLA